MPEQRQKIQVPADPYGRAYIGVLKSNLSADAKLCYTVMWSFGAEIFATVANIGLRMSRSENTVRKAQTELKEGGWIVLVEESLGRKTKTWRMVIPDQGGTGSNPSCGEGLDLPTPHGLKGSTPHGVNPIDLRSKPKEKTTPPANAGAQAGPSLWIAEFEKRWSRKFTVHCHFQSKASSKTIADLMAKGVTLEEFLARVDRYLGTDDDYVRKMNYSLHCLLTWRWNQLYEAPRVAARTAKPELAL